MEYDSLFVFEELGWNFEPSELGAAFGLEQLKKLPRNYEVRQRNYDRYQAFFADHLEHFDPPVQLDGLETAWLAFPFVIRPEGGFARSDFQAELDMIRRMRGEFESAAQAAAPLPTSPTEGGGADRVSGAIPPLPPAHTSPLVGEVGRGDAAPKEAAE